MTTVVDRLARPVPNYWRRIVLGGIGIFVVVLCLPHMAYADVNQLFTATQRLGGGHLSGLYPAGQISTSAPGYPLAAALPYDLARLVWGPLAAYQRSALLVLPCLVAAAVYAARRLGLTPRSGAELLLAAVVALSVPVLNALYVTFHPQDLLALCWVLLAVGALVDHRWVLAGTLLALGLFTRQWVVLALPASLAWVPAGRSRRTVAGMSVGVVLILLAPFALLDGQGLVTALGGGPFASGRVDFWLQVPGGVHFGPMLARLGPVAFAAGVALVLAIHWRHSERSSNLLIWALAAVLTGRVLFDTYNAYYLAPGLVAFAVADSLDSRKRGTTAAATAAVLALMIKLPVYDPQGRLALGIAYMTMFLLVIAHSLRQCMRPELGAPGVERDREAGRAVESSEPSQAIGEGVAPDRAGSLVLAGAS